MCTYFYSKLEKIIFKININVAGYIYAAKAKEPNTEFASLSKDI